MASPNLLQNKFESGVKRDRGRDDLPTGALWYATDMLPNIGARARERGGWANASDSITATVATAAYIVAGAYVPYAAGNTQVAIDEDGNLVKIVDDTSVTNVGACAVPRQNPVFHRDKLIVPAATPKKVTNAAGTLTIANLGGSPPGGLYAGVFNDRTLLARSAANPERLWFSDPGDPEGWDTINTYWDFGLPITALVSLRTAILVFHEAALSRLRGTTPPPGSDFIADDPLWNVGCSDARSIGLWKDQIIFASGGGIHITDGAGYDNLTRLCGMQDFWLETLAGYSTSWTITGAVIRDNYFLSVMNGSTLVHAAMIDLRRLAWWPLTNLKASSMWAAQSSTDELYFGRRDAARVGKLSGIFTPAAANKTDGDGTAVAGTVETPFYRGSPGEKSWRKLYLTDELEDYAADNPTVAASYIKTPEATAYTALGSFSETTGENRRRMTLGFAADGIALKLVRAGAGDWRLQTIEAEVAPRERSR